MASPSADLGLRGARVLVTGAAGFIGREVVRALDRAGAQVVAPHRPGSPPPVDLPGDHTELDVVRTDALVELAGGCTHLVHLAARSGGIQFQHADHAEVLAENTAMTRSVLDAAATAGVQRVFLASSAVVYAPEAASPIGEDAPTVAPGRGPVSGYAWSKLTDEALASWYGEEGLGVVAGRFTNVYGPGGSFDPGRSTVVHALVERACAAAGTGDELVVWGDGTAERSFLFVQDAATAVLTVLVRGGSGSIYNLDAGEALSIRQVAEAIRDAVDPGLVLRFDPDRPQGPARRVLDDRRLRGLGFTPRTSFADGVARTVAAYRG